MRIGKEAATWGRGQISQRSRDWTGYCLVFVRSCFGVGPGSPSAITAWEAAKKKHRTSDSSKIPAFVPVFWRGGKYGHVAFSLNRGLCISTDVKRRGWPNIVSIDSISRAWGYELLGWTEDINGVTVYTPPAKRTVHITAALKARSVSKRIEELKKVVAHGNKTSAKAAQQWIDALNERQALDKKIASARATLAKQERK